MTNRKQRRANKNNQKTTKSSGITPVSDPLNQLFKQGLQYQQAGDLAKAEQIYRQILNVNPNHVHTLHMMGVIAHNIGQHNVAEELILSAINVQPDPLFFGSLGNVYRALKRFEDAVKAYKSSLAGNPNHLGTLNNLGISLFSTGNVEDAIQVYNDALKIDPNNTDTINNLGVAYHNEKQYEMAVLLFEKSLKIKQDTQILFNLARSKYFLNGANDSKQEFEKVLKVDPNHADAIFSLGKIAREEGDYEGALRHFTQLKAIRPNAHTHANIALVLHDQGRLQEATLQYRQAIKLSPNDFELWNNIAMIYNDVSEYEESIAAYKKALELNPDNATILSNIASSYKDIGQLDEAIYYLKRAVETAPTHRRMYSNLLLTMLYAASVSPEEHTAISKEFDVKVAAPLLRKKPFNNSKDPERIIRIGYLSPDFCKHAVHYFLEPLLVNLDRNNFEVFAYSNTPREDGVTERIKKEVDHWRDVRFISDDAIADLIESDKIDILIDPTGHTGQNNLEIFARKPAPIQLSWMGYPATTGMKAMDYKITDPYAEPLGMTEHLNVETLWRMPEIFCCYQAGETTAVVIDHPPFEDNGYIIFGCFNNFAKVTDEVMKTWAKILEKVSNSKLLLEIYGVDMPLVRNNVERRLKQANMPLERVILETRRKTNQYHLYNKIDIALDPFPCNGGTTSMDTLWMGVPMVTLAGRHFVSRMGVTILTNAGLPELIANSEEEYIKFAVDLANDRERLKKMRHGLRDRVKASPLMDQERFARNMETAYREMWRKWCASNPE